MSQLDLHRNETTLWPFQKLQALQSHNMMKSNLGSLRDEEPEERLRQAQELWALKEKMEIQVSQGPMPFFLNQARNVLSCNSVSCYFQITFHYMFVSVQFSYLVMSDSLQPHGQQHTRPPCPSPTAGVYPNPCPSSR